MPTTQLAANSWELFRDGQKSGIAAAIIELVNEQDSPITIAQISERAGVSRPTFYKYFPTIGAAMLFVHRQVIEQMSVYGQVHTHSDGVDGITQFLEQISTLAVIAQARPDLLRFTSYFDYTFRRYGLTDDEHRVLGEDEANLFAIARAPFERGQKDGSIRPDLDATHTVEAIGTSILGLAQRVLVTESAQTDIEHHFAIAFDAWRRYLST